MARFSLEGFESLVDAASPAVLTTYRKDLSVLVSPVWFNWSGADFEVVIAEGDVKLRHLARDPRAVLVIFETVPPFRGLEIRGDAILKTGDVTEIRRTIASRYLGHPASERFTRQRATRPGVLLQLAPENVRRWDLNAILPE